MNAVTTVYLILAIASVLLWLPILCRFYVSWNNRRNPISLAICAMILMLIWVAIAGTWVVSETIDTGMVMFVSTGLSTAFATYAHVAFYWAKKRFPDRRDG